MEPSSQTDVLEAHKSESVHVDSYAVQNRAVIAKIQNGCANSMSGL